MADGKAVGRSRLKGVLDNLVQKSLEEREDFVTVDEDVEDAARDLLELSDDGNRTRKRKQGRLMGKKRKKRMRKERIEPDGKLSPENVADQNEEDKYIPHVMTLFDRKVDLAQFSVDTPLYVMCREWMSNNPNKSTSLTDVYGSFINIPPPTNTHTFTLDTNLTLAPPTPLPTDKGGCEIRIDIPKPHPPISKGIKDIEQHIYEALTDKAGDLELYKREHQKRWREVRRRWTVASTQNQLRYGSSLRRLKSMFQRV